MNKTDAMNILAISGTVTQAEIKKAYKAASLKYHPDRNPAGIEMMKAVNAAYEFLSGLQDDVTMDSGANAYDYGDELNEVLNELMKIPGINIEVCGNWIWVTGDTRPHAKKLGSKERGGLGLFFAKKKIAWYYRPEEYKSRSRQSVSMDEIRVRHGSSVYKSSGLQAIA